MNLLPTLTAPLRKTSLNSLFFSVTSRFTPCMQWDGERLLAPAWLGKQELVETGIRIALFLKQGLLR